MQKMNHKFVKTIPKELEDDTIYISKKYKTAIHKCPCGCNRRVVTPLTPINWTLTYEDEKISLFPSIGNWDYPCRSHYWIKDSQIYWDRKWTEKEIKINKLLRKKRRQKYMSSLESKEKFTQKKSSQGVITRIYTIIRDIIKLCR